MKRNSSNQSSMNVLYTQMLWSWKHSCLVLVEWTEYSLDSPLSLSY